MTDDWSRTTEPSAEIVDLPAERHGHDAGRGPDRRPAPERVGRRPDGEAARRGGSSLDRASADRSRASGSPVGVHGVGDGAGLIVCDGLVKIYKVADLEVVALQGLDLVVDPGELVAIVGASGSGKSTLLNILGGLDVPSAGRAVVAGHELTAMGAREQTLYLRRAIGFVWQQTARNLFPYLTALENVTLPMVLDGVGSAERERRARDLLAQVGLDDRADHRPDRLSGGEQQRAAIAVALANRPQVILADEPTGELDTTMSHQILDLFRRLNAELGVTVVVATHDPLISEQVPRTIAIRDGRVSTEVVRGTSRSAEGVHDIHAVEYAVLDRAGRLQLPRAHVEALRLERRVRLELEEDHIGVWPDQRGRADAGPGRRDPGDGQERAPADVEDGR